MAGNRENEMVGAMPFRRLTNFELEQQLESPRAYCTEKLEHNGFKKFVEQYRNENPTDNNFNGGCKYYDCDQFTKAFRNPKSKLSVFHMNVRRIAKHRGEILAFLSTLEYDFDVITLTEVGDDANSYITDTFLENYIAFTEVPQLSKYGGATILVRKTLGQVTIRSDMQIKKQCECEKCAIENIWIQIQTEHDTYIIGCIYRHPNGNTSHFTTELEKTLESVPHDTNCIITGDININLLNYEQEQSLNYLSLLLSNNFSPFITLPTRLTENKATLIDHIFMKLSRKHLTTSISSGNIFTDITDHLPNFVILEDKIPTKTNTRRPLIRIFSDKNVASFDTKLHDTNWDQLLAGDNSDDMYSAFYTHLYNVYNTSFPLVRQSRKRSKDKEWITSALKNSIKHKNNLYKIQLKKPTVHNISKYKTYRNLLNVVLKQAEILYYNELFQNRQNSITNFWRAFSQTLNPNRRKTAQHIQKLLVNNQETTEGRDIANGLNDYFCNVGKNIQDNLPTVNGNFRDYLKNRIQQTFFLSPVTLQEIFKELVHMNPRKSAGPDDFTPRLLKSAAMHLCKPLFILYNKSIADASFPDIWKLAKVIPLFKKQSRHLPENYRPISLLNCFGKILERLIYNQMVKFIEKYHILYKHQYGFRKAFSTTLALINIIDQIKTSIDKGEYVIGIFLDIKKAFDSIDHEILLSKLEHYGFRGHILTFIKSYLTNRKQFIEINECKSRIQNINCGVPQGSILGPLLFLLFINDIQNSAPDTEKRLFADDTSVFLFGKNINNVIAESEQKTTEIQKWYILNKLSLSIGKSNFILFHSHKKKINYNISHLKIGQDIIPRVRSAKYIGLNIDERLTWETH